MTSTLDTKSLAAHVLVVLARAQRADRIVTIHDVAAELDVRKNDVRDVVTRLHREGHVDALRLRLSFSGFALAAVLASATLRTLRATRAAATGSSSTRAA
jgi:hypothetical protein